MMKFSIIFNNDQILVEAQKNIKAKEFFKMVREKCNIDVSQKLILIGENNTFDEKDKIDTLIISSKVSVKEEFILLCVDNYNLDKLCNKTEEKINFKNLQFLTPNFEEKTQVEKNESYSTEDLIMKITGATEPIKIKNIPKRNKQRRNYLGFNYESILNYRPSNFFRFRLEDEANNYDDLSHYPIDNYNDNHLEVNNNSINTNQNNSALNNQTYYNPFSIANGFLGRLRLRESVEREVNTENSANSNLNFTISSNLNNSNNQRDNSEQFLHISSRRTNLQPSFIRNSISSRNIYIPRQEDVTRLVNEMGFPENQVTNALTITRGNVNRAVDLLLFPPEQLEEMNIPREIENYLDMFPNDYNNFEPRSSDTFGSNNPNNLITTSNIPSNGINRNRINSNLQYSSIIHPYISNHRNYDISNFNEFNQNLIITANSENNTNINQNSNVIELHHAPHELNENCYSNNIISSAINENRNTDERINGEIDNGGEVNNLSVRVSLNSQNSDNRINNLEGDLSQDENLENIYNYLPLPHATFQENQHDIEESLSADSFRLDGEERLSDYFHSIQSDEEEENI